MQVVGFGGFIRDSEHYVAEAGDNVAIYFNDIRLTSSKET